MNEIVQMVAQKFNLSPEVSQQIVTFLLQQLKVDCPRAWERSSKGS